MWAGGLRGPSVGTGATTGYSQNGGGGRQRAEGAVGVAGGTHPFQHLDEAQRLLEAAPAHPGQDPVLRNGEIGVNGGTAGAPGCGGRGAPGSSAGHGWQRGPTWSRGVLSPPEGAPDSAMAAAVGAVGGCHLFLLLRPPPPQHRSQSRPRAATRSPSAPGRAQPPRPGHSPDRPRPPPATTVHGAAPDRPHRTPRSSSGVNPAPGTHRTHRSLRPSLRPSPSPKPGPSEQHRRRPGTFPDPPPRERGASPRARPRTVPGEPQRPRAAAYRAGSAAQGGKRKNGGRAATPHWGSHAHAGLTALGAERHPLSTGSHRGSAPLTHPTALPAAPRAGIAWPRPLRVRPRLLLIWPRPSIVCPRPHARVPAPSRSAAAQPSPRPSALAPPHSLPSEPALLAFPLAALLSLFTNGLAARAEVT